MRRLGLSALILGIAAVAVAAFLAVPETRAFLAEWSRYSDNEAVKAHDLRYVGGGVVLFISPPDPRLLIVPLLDLALAAAAVVLTFRALRLLRTTEYRG